MRTREDLFEEILREVVGPKAAEAQRAISCDAFNLGWTMALNSLADLSRGENTIDDLSLSSTLTEVLKNTVVDLSERQGGYVSGNLSRMFLEDIIKSLKKKGLSYTLHKPKKTEED